MLLQPFTGVSQIILDAPMETSSLSQRSLECGHLSVLTMTQEVP